MESRTCTDLLLYTTYSALDEYCLIIASPLSTPHLFGTSIHDRNLVRESVKCA